MKIAGLPCYNHTSSYRYSEEKDLDNRLKPESKKSIIRCAHEVLLRDGFDEFSIRKVATECGCGVSSIYRHFSSKDELLLYAATRNINSYLKELSSTWKKGENSLYNYFSVEQSFAKYTFTEPLLFYNMYFGPVSHLLDRIFEESKELFPEVYSSMTEDLLGLLSVSGGIAARNLAMLERCCQDGFLQISAPNLILLNEGLIRMYRGFLDEAILLQRRGENTDELKQMYLVAHRLMHQSFLSADVSLPPL